MKLVEQIQQQTTQALLDKNTTVLNILRSVKAKITEAEKSNKQKTLSEDEVVRVIEKLAKQCQESIKAFQVGQRPDLLKIEEEQLAILQAFLPQKMDEAATITAIQTAVAAGATNIGSLMKSLSQYGSLIDKQLVAQLAPKFL